MKVVRVSIKGVSPLLMRRFPLEEANGMDKKTPAEQAEHAAYRDRDGMLYVPGLNVQRCLVSAAAYSKGKGRASLAKVAAACFTVSPEQITLGTKTYVIDTQPVVIKATKGRVPRHRPKLNEWGFTFELEYDETLMSEKQVNTIIIDAGKRVGLLDFRPACGGSYGRFILTRFEAQ